MFYTNYIVLLFFSSTQIFCSCFVVLNLAMLQIALLICPRLDHVQFAFVFGMSILDMLGKQLPGEPASTGFSGRRVYTFEQRRSSRDDEETRNGPLRLEIAMQNLLF